MPYLMIILTFSVEFFSPFNNALESENSSKVSATVFVSNSLKLFVCS